jgi:hypothetical protein
LAFWVCFWRDSTDDGKECARREQSLHDSNACEGITCIWLKIPPNWTNDFLPDQLYRFVAELPSASFVPLDDVFDVWASTSG